MLSSFLLDFVHHILLMFSAKRGEILFIFCEIHTNEQFFLFSFEFDAQHSHLGRAISCKTNWCCDVRKIKKQGGSVRVETVTSRKKVSKS